MRRAALVAAALGALATLSATSIAFAFWGTSGSGTGTATVATLDAPTDVAASSVGTDVTVTWTAPTPPEGTLSGYTVSRWDGAARHDACGTDPAQSATYVPDGTLTCTDTGVPDGDHTYSVTAVFRTWTAESTPSAAVAVEAPQQSVALAAGATNASLTGTTLFYRSAVAGGFALRSTVTSVLAGPASATFPAIGTTGWTHPGETVTSGSGGPPTTAYTSSPYSWDPSPAQPATHVVTGRDSRGGIVETGLTLTPDDDSPTGGALTVNGVAAEAVPTISYATADYPIDSRTDYSTDAGSGVATSVLTVRSAPLSENVCGAFGASAYVVGTPTQVGTSPACYLYVLTGTDAVGNAASVSSVVKYDADLPAQTVTLISGANAALSGTTVYFRGADGSFALSSEVTDGESGPASAEFTGIATAGWTHGAETVTTGTGAPPTRSYASTTYSFTAVASTPPNHPVRGRDVAGNVVTTTLAFVRDTTAPTGGALTVNGGVASAGGTTSFSTTGDFGISLRTDYTDAASGIDTSVLTVASATLAGNTCGTYGTPTPLAGAPDQVDLATGCHRYTLTGTDRVGNLTFVSHTVKVDRGGPVGGAVTINGTAADGSPAGTLSHARTNPVLVNARTNWSDAESGLASSTLTSAFATLTNGTCATYGSTSTITGTTSQTLTSPRCYRYVLTGTDNAGNASSVSTVVRYDTALPVTGALNVNGVAANGAGTTSFNKTGAFAIGSRTDWTDAGSGIASSVLTVATAPLSANTCGAYGTATELAGTPAQSGLTTGCHRYTLTGTDLAGNVATTTHTVKVDLEPATGGAVTINGTAASPAGTTSGPTNATAIPIDSRADYTDAGSGLSSSTLIRAAGSFTGGACGTFSGSTTITGTTTQTGLATNCYRYTLTGTDNATNSASISTIVKVDYTLPVTGALTVNGVAASAVGTSSFNKTGSFTIGTRTDYTDAASGIASSVLTVAAAPLSANTCGAYGPVNVLAGNPAQSGLATGCYRYVITGTDLAGNVASRTHTVKVDRDVPTGGAVAVNGTAAAAVSTTSGPTGATSFPVDSRTDYVDAESGLASSLLIRAAGTYIAGNCGTFSGSTTITGTTAQSGLATSCYRYTLTGTDNATNAAAVSTIVKVDVTPPASGALTVNGVAASAAGTSSFNTTGSFTIATRTEYTDAASGLASSVLTLASAPLSANTCGTYTSPTVLTGKPAQSGLATGCYRYTLTGTDNATNTAAISTIVKVDAAPPTGGALTVNEVAASAAGTVSTGNSDSFTIGARTDYTDAASGLASSTLTREFATLSGSTCAAFSGSVTITGTPDQTGLAAGCYRYTLTGLDNAGNTSQIFTTVHRDVADGIRVTPSVVPLGVETLVNTTTDGSQDSNNVVMQAVASDADGNYVVAWHGPGTGRDVYAQRFSADGTALGVELTVNTYKNNAQAMPNVAMDAAGNFVIAWRSQGQDDIETDPSHGIYAQRYNAAGEPAGGEFRVNSTTAGLQDQPALAMASDGSFVIAWTSDDGLSTGIFAQRYDANGDPQGGEFRVNTFTSGAQNLPSVGMDAAGNFVITWTSASTQDGSGTGIFGQRYDLSGTARGLEFLVNSTTEGSQSYADVAMLADGRFVVAWQTEGSSAIHLQRYGAGGSRLGGETHVNATLVSSAASLPSVSADASGNIVVVWTSPADGDGNGVFGQRLDWSGAPLGGEFVVNSTTAGDQNPGEVVAQPGVGFVVAWFGAGAGDPDGVFMRRYGLSTTEAGGTATFDVVLEMAPTADVVIPVSVPDSTEGTVSVASLTFASTTWNVAQTVSVTGVQDYSNDGDQVYTVVLGAASSTDSNFNGLDPADLSVTSSEVPNLAPVIFAPGAQDVAEGTALVFSAGSGNLISISDGDAGTNAVQVALSVTNGTLTLADGFSGLAFASGAGTADTAMTFTGTIASVNAALDGLRFDPTAAFSGAALLTIDINDLGNSGTGGSLSDVDTVDITVHAGP